MDLQEFIFKNSAEPLNWKIGHLTPNYTKHAAISPGGNEVQFNENKKMCSCLKGAMVQSSKNTRSYWPSTGCTANPHRRNQQA